MNDEDRFIVTILMFFLVLIFVFLCYQGLSLTLENYDLKAQLQLQHNHDALGCLMHPVGKWEIDPYERTYHVIYNKK